MKPRLRDILIPTKVARRGTLVAEVFEECVCKNVSGIPFVDDRDRVIGRVSIRNTLKFTCVPEYMVKAAHLLGDNLSAVDIPSVDIMGLLNSPVDPFVMEEFAMVGPESPIIKTISIMERFNSGYIFVVDHNHYLGIATRMGVARLMMECRNKESSLCI